MAGGGWRVVGGGWRVASAGWRGAASARCPDSASCVWRPASCVWRLAGEPLQDAGFRTPDTGLRTQGAERWARDAETSPSEQSLPTKAAATTPFGHKKTPPPAEADGGIWLVLAYGVLLGETCASGLHRFRGVHCLVGGLVDIPNRTVGGLNSLTSFGITAASEAEGRHRKGECCEKECFFHTGLVFC